MRCLALAEALRDQGATVVFASVEMTAALLVRIKEEGFSHHPLSCDNSADIVAFSQQFGASGLVVDSYCLDSDWRAAVRSAFDCVLALDDLADRPLHADLVWNPAPNAAALPYARLAPQAHLLAGDDYVLLRRDIRMMVETTRQPLSERRRILVTFGGSDPAGLTVPVVKRLAPALPDSVFLDVVAGGSNPALDCIRAACARFPAQVTLHIDTRTMGTLMAASGLCISAGGGTIAELAALGVPSILTIVANNQAAAARDALQRGWATVIDARGDRATAADAITHMALS